MRHTTIETVDCTGKEATVHLKNDTFKDGRISGIVVFINSDWIVVVHNEYSYTIPMENVVFIQSKLSIKEFEEDEKGK